MSSRTFEYDFKIGATDENEAEAKMAALAVLAQKLSTKELTTIADALKNSPAKVRLAKQLLKKL